MPADVIDAAPDGRTELLGRARELAELEQHLGTGPDGTPRGGVTLLAGDAGMGKTRLLGELTDRARARGLRVLVGHSLDFADQLLPYLPFSEILGRLADDDPDLAGRVAEQHPAVRALAPGRRLMSRTDPGSGGPEDALLDRGAVFAAVHGALELLASEGPLLVVLEDLHWADRSTRDLLSFLLARRVRGPVGIVASYRSDDLHRRHPLRAVVGEWGRLPGVRRMQLAPLEDHVVRRLVRALHPGPVRERDVAWVVERAEGNAFFAEELVGASRGGAGSALPDDLADLLLVRLDQLDETSRQVVRAAACAGRRVSHALLAAVLGLPEDQLDAGLRAAVDSHVLVRVGADGYAFRHALLAEAVYGDLLPGERVRLHGQYVEALTAGPVGATAAELARHARAAHDVDTAVRAGVRAGEEAMAVGGPDDAAEHFQAVLELLAAAAVSPPEPVDLVDLVRRTSEAVVATGQPGRAMALVRDHLDQADRTGRLDPRDRARLLLAWAAAAVVNESREDPTIATAEALRLIGDEPGPLRTRALSLHARCLADEGRDEEAARQASEALAMAQRLEMHRVAAEAVTTLAALDSRSGHFDSAAQALEAVVTAARDGGDTEAEMRGRLHLALIELEEGRVARAHDLFGQAAAAARASGRPWAPYGFDARYQHAVTALLLGRWDETWTITDLAGEAPPTDAEALLTSLRMLVGAGRGDASVLRHYEPLKASWRREALVAVSSGAAAIELLGARGDLDGVWRVHDEVVESASASWRPEFHARARLSALVLGQLASASSAARGSRTAHPAHQHLGRADELLDVVESIDRTVARRPRGFGPEGRAWVVRTRAEHLRLRWLTGTDVPSHDELVELWQRSVEAFDAFGHRHEAARSRARLASVLLAAGRAREAMPLRSAARATAEELGALPLLAEVATAGSRAPAATDGEPALTPRETEILALVAEGRSNGQVASQLFISTKTVSVHVSSILAKLGASGRTEAAAIARRRGLLDR